MDKNKHILNQGMEEPSADFTKNVMRGIDAEEKTLAGVLSNYGVEAPSDAFTANLMAKVAGKVPQAVKPVISRSVWMGIACVFIAGIVLGLVYGTESGHLSLAFDTEGIKASVQSFVNGDAIAYTLMGIFGIALMLLLDQKLKRKSDSFAN